MFVQFVVAFFFFLSLFNLSYSYSINNIQPFGCEIIGIDVENITDEEFNIVHKALLDCRVVSLRDQKSLTVEGQRKFSQRFGKLQVHLESSSHHPDYKDVNLVSNIKNPETGKYIGLYGKHVEEFHSDLSWSPIPTKITTLKSKIRPDSCGATEFISSTYSYNILPLSIKKFLYKKKIFYYYLKHTKSNQFGNKKNEANKKNYKKLDNYNKKLLLNIFNEMKENNFIINDEFEYDSNVDSILFSKTEEDLDDFYTLTLEDEKELIQTIKKELENDTEIENELKEKLLNEVLNEINNSYEDNNEEISDETILENYFSLYINKIEPSITTSVSKDSTDRLQSDEINKANEFQVYHPGVIYHPITKKKNLYLNSSHSLFFKYFNKKVSHAILSYITQYIQRNILRYEWKDDDYILWDNRSVQHRATGCPDDKPRLLIRTTIEVDAPPSDLYIGEFDGQYDLLADRTQASIFTPFQILKTEEL